MRFILAPVVGLLAFAGAVEAMRLLNLKETPFWYGPPLVIALLWGTWILNRNQ